MDRFEGHPDIPPASEDDERPRRRPRMTRNQYWFAMWGFLITILVAWQVVFPMHRFARINWSVVVLFVLGWAGLLVGVGGTLVLVFGRRGFDSMSDGRRFRVVMVAWAIIPVLMIYSVIANILFSMV